jgi:tetratricopeptide (TPR) repeat protein
MSNLNQSKIASGMLWATTVVLVSVGAYFVGWGAEAKYEDLITIDTPPPEVKLEEQGRYDEAIQAVLDRRREGLHEAHADSQVAQIYLDRAKKDLANREKWAQQAAFYFDKAAALAPGDPFILESAMDGFNKAGDYSEQGCPHYEKAVAFGEAALALLQGSTVTIEGHVRSYPTQPIKEGIQPRLKRIRGKVDAWCKKTY